MMVICICNLFFIHFSNIRHIILIVDISNGGDSSDGGVAPVGAADNSYQPLFPLSEKPWTEHINMVPLQSVSTSYVQL